MRKPANTPTKTRWPHATGLTVANAICEALAPHCERISIAGSIRRMAADVGDVEIVYIPKTRRYQIDLLKWGEISLADLEINRLVAAGILAKRLSKIGTVAWGPMNKLAVHFSGLPVDFCATTAACWYNYLVCRTGPAPLNARIALAAHEKGFKWTPYGTGFRHLQTGQIIDIASEESVFEFAGIPYLPTLDSNSTTKL